MKPKFLMLPLTEGADALVNISSITSIVPAVSAEGTEVSFDKYKICTTIPFSQMCAMLRAYTIKIVSTDHSPIQ